MRRRRFLVAGTAGLAAVSAPWVLTGRSRASLVIRNVTIYDGTGRPPTEGDLSVEDGISLILSAGVAVPGEIGEESVRKQFAIPDKEKSDPVAR